jgi:hypothetical protein
MRPDIKGNERTLVLRCAQVSTNAGSDSGIITPKVTLANRIAIGTIAWRQVIGARNEGLEKSVGLPDGREHRTEIDIVLHDFNSNNSEKEF